MMNFASSKVASLRFINMLVLIDMMSIGMIIPVLQPLLQSITGQAVDNIIVLNGLLLALYGLSSFLFAPLMGALSDRFGRRPLLLLSMFGLMLDHLLLAHAPSLFWIFVARALAGFCGESYVVAMAYVADITDTNERTKHYGKLGMMWGLGFILGPAIGGVLGGIDVRLPFYCAAALCLMNLIYGYCVVAESLPKELRTSKVRFAQSNPLAVFTGFTAQPNVLRLAWVVFFSNMGFQALVGNWNLFLQYQMHWGVEQIGWALMFVGLVAALAQGVFMGRMSRWLGDYRLLMVGLCAQAAEMFVMGSAYTLSTILLAALSGAIGVVVHPTYSSMISQWVSEKEQGVAQGAIAGVEGITLIIGPLASAYVFDYFTHNGWAWAGSVMYYGGLMVLISMVMLLWVKHTRS